MTAIPKLASTVVLIDDFSNVYLTKRPTTMKFMGGFHVFPGGAVEAGDSVINMDYVNAEVIDQSVSLSHYIAAARELFEEVGVLLGNTMDGLPVQLLKEKEWTYRHKLLNGEISFNHVLEQEGIYLDLTCLTYFGQIITPQENPIRFDTRFFLAKLPQGQMPEPDQTEIDEALWVSPEEALIACQNKKIKLAPPTIISLETMIQYKNGGALMMSVTENDLLKLLRNL